MNLLIYASSLCYSRHIEDEPFVKSDKTNFIYITLFTKYLVLYDNLM